MDIEKLKELTSPNNIPADVVMRPFLIEDITAPVIEVLGTAFDCHPMLFAEHMHTVGYGQPSSRIGLLTKLATL
ncbi:hypothetical protein C8A03DRAFT_38537 [Achaetomium macrosporum]|uniref:Uncharacterized protein n=1 Tax=Achaetomium macrosporum TaxID=79813 RepID=A0AAN7HAE5_9PEZI|nr:hypothetical protein C8A03DRAFT_38537 [Achaetomium macrosporum]